MYVVHTPIYRDGAVMPVALLSTIAYATLLVALKATDDLRMTTLDAGKMGAR